MACRGRKRQRRPPRAPRRNRCFAGERAGTRPSGGGRRTLSRRTIIGYDRDSHLPLAPERPGPLRAVPPEHACLVMICRLHPQVAPPARRALAPFLLVGSMLAGSMFAVDSAAEAAQPLEGYDNYEAFRARVEELNQSELITATSLAKTLEGRDVMLLTVGTGEVHQKPALVVVGNVEAAQLFGTHLALGIAKRFAQQADQEKVHDLLDRYTIYIIPRPSPDAAEKCFATPRRRPVGNARKTDDDRDHQFGEDPPEDLNGDGAITLMRVADETGPLRSHPDDPRVMFAADRTKGESGQWRTYVEGIDNDKDGKFNEDAGDGVAFNRNFTFRYRYFSAGAGPHQVSEIETRAIADFLFERTNVAAVFAFTPDDNLRHTWTTGKNPRNIPVHIDADDLRYVSVLGKQYRQRHGGQEFPKAAAGSGSFSEWVYYHYGRWSLASPGWWIPQTDAPAAEADATADHNGNGNEPSKTPSYENRGADDINALNFLAAHDIDGFVDWTPIEHPDFPGQRVEVGGFLPLVRDNPPAAQFEELAEHHYHFLVDVLGKMPQLAIQEAEVAALGGGVFRVEATAINRGFLPTSSVIGYRSKLAQRVQIALDLPEGAALIRGPQRRRLPRLAGSGGTATHSWLFRADSDLPAGVRVRAWTPVVGEDEVELQLEEAATE
ncbi:MAG: hypothetical protein DWQ42_18935 [Planctomycetota bacterium]|nr:MAG: hypothetical protein DWQ42_18935 [Planctomycetota bacterium]REK43162.1 MAG: hypothetical protein DWQ46_12380 [Planctomycetota bacterium]